MSWIWIRRGLAGLLLVLAVYGLLRPADAAGDRRAVLRTFEETADLRISPDLGERLDSEPDPMHLRVLLARRLVSAETQPDRLAEITRGTPDLRPEVRVERLERARSFALEVLRARPAAWDAAMLVGASTYLARSTVRDPRLFTDQRGWEGPLELAWQLAPAEPESERFLVTAYLELWPALSDTKRVRARSLLAEAFSDKATFGRLVEAWLSVAEDRDEAFAAIPAEPHAWRTLSDVYERRHDWSAYREAHGRWLEVLTESLQEDLERAGRRLTAGYPEQARRSYLEILDASVPSTAHVPLVQRVLREMPAGPPTQRTATAAREWLLWALDRNAFAPASFPPRLLDRLAGLAGALEPHHEAHAALLADRLDEAERIERRTALTWHEDWIPYLLARSRDALERGDTAEAEAALNRAHRSARERPSYWQARLEVANATARSAPRAEAERRLDALTATEWPATAWSFRDGRAFLEIRQPTDASGIGLELLDAPAQGAVAEVRIDGEVVGWIEALAGSETRVAAPVSAGLHRLEVRTTAGKTVRPGRVRILD